MGSKIIVALDNMERRQAHVLARKLEGKVWGFKVNDLLLTEGVSIIRTLKKYGKVMADPKLFDIPNTMKNSIETLCEAGADIITVHGLAHYHEAKIPAKLAGITILTSASASWIRGLYDCDVEPMVYKLATFINHWGYGYMVCAANDLARLGKFSAKKITPGIRPDWYQKNDDQKRRMTPSEAVRAGSDLLVIGRPITQSENPVEAVDMTNEEIREALAKVE